MKPGSWRAICVAVIWPLDVKPDLEVRRLLGLRLSSVRLLAVLPDFDAQCETFLKLAPTAISSIMGLFPPTFVGRLKERGIAWFATATTLDEAKLARAAGADAIIAQQRWLHQYQPPIS